MLGSGLKTFNVHRLFITDQISSVIKQHRRFAKIKFHLLDYFIWQKINQSISLTIWVFVFSLDSGKFGSAGGQMGEEWAVGVGTGLNLETKAAQALEIWWDMVDVGEVTNVTGDSGGRETPYIVMQECKRQAYWNKSIVHLLVFQCIFH